MSLIHHQPPPDLKCEWKYCAGSFQHILQQQCKPADDILVLAQMKGSTASIHSHTMLQTVNTTMQFRLHVGFQESLNSVLGAVRGGTDCDSLYNHSLFPYMLHSHTVWYLPVKHPKLLWIRKTLKTFKLTK